MDDFQIRFSSNFVRHEASEVKQSIRCKNYQHLANALQKKYSRIKQAKIGIKKYNFIFILQELLERVAATLSRKILERPFREKGLR